MARAAGSSSHYSDAIWRPRYTGADDPGPVRPLPAVTHIIKSTVANPVLMGWAERTLRDMLAGLLGHLVDPLTMDPEDGYAPIDLISDSDVLYEWLKENKMRVRDITKMHQDRGTAEHWHLEELTKRPTRDAQIRLAERYLKSANGWRRGIGEWWLQNEPKVIASERVLPHPKAGYCGSVDLIWHDGNGNVGITDLKTRLEEREAYDSDEFQVDAYASAWVANGGTEPNFRAVLVVREDGTFIDHRDFTIERGDFEKVLNLYVARKEVKNER